MKYLFPRVMLLICFLFLIGNFAAILPAFAQTFSPTVMEISSPEEVGYSFNGSTLEIPLTVSGVPGAFWLVINTDGKADQISQVRNGYLGWHYVDQIDTTVYVSGRYQKDLGSQTINWDGTDADGNPVPEDIYSYYIWGYDDQSPRQKVTDFVPTSNHWDSPMNTVYTYDEQGMPLEKPFFFGNRFFHWADDDVAWKRFGTAWKWELGSNPEDVNNLETTWMPFYVDREYAKTYAYGGPVLMPGNYNKYVHASDHYPSETTTMMQWTFVSGGEATYDPTWLGWEQGVEWEGIHPAGFWAERPTVYTNPDGSEPYIYGPQPAAHLRGEQWGPLVVVTWDGNKVFRRMMDEWYMPNEPHPRNYVNGSPISMSTRGNNLWQWSSWLSCLQEMIDTSKLLIDPDDDQDYIKWQNKNGDYFLDKYYWEDAETPWICLDDVVGKNGISNAGLDNELFSLYGRENSGSTCLTIFSQDGTGIADVSFFDVGASPYPFKSHFIDSGSQYDGIYCPPPKSDDIEKHGLWYVAFDSNGGKIVPDLNPFIVVKSPILGNTFIAESKTNITWNSKNVENINIEYSIDDALNWYNIDTNIDASTGVYEWTTPSMESSECIVRISDAQYQEVFDMSEPFSIVKINPDSEYKILFSSTRDKVFYERDIFIMDFDGSHQEPLTEAPLGDRGPDWSPDGSKIVFQSGRDENGEIYIMDRDGSDENNLTKSNENEPTYATFSPVDSLIAYTSVIDGNYEICIMDWSGNFIKNLTNNPAHDEYPSWSADGKEIIFNSNRDGTLGIYTINVADGIVKMIINTPGSDYQPHYSPNENFIVFCSNWVDGQVNTGAGAKSEIYIVNADGSNLTRKTFSTESGWERAFSARWTPDGAQIVFEFGTGVLPDRYSQIHITNAFGNYQNPINLSNSEESHYDPVVSSLELTPELIITQLMNNIVIYENIQDGVKTSLIEKLENIIEKIEMGNINAAIKQLGAFINQVEAKRGKKNGLTQEQADELIESAENIITILSDTDGAAKQAINMEDIEEELPQKFGLSQNSPNPFNPSTTIQYTIPEGSSGNIKLNVYDLRGALVRKLVDDITGPGAHSVVWNGTDDTGRQVSSGIYFYRIMAGDFIQSNKMILVR